MTVALVTLLSYLGLSAPRRVVAETPLPPPKKTGGPGEGSCSCHGGSGGDGQVEILGAPTQYTPGTSYTLTVRLRDPGQSRWGFEATVLLNSDNSMAGSLASTDGTTGLQTQSGRQYVSHNSQGSGGTVDGTFAGTADGPVSWPFQWTAPSAGAGAVTVYVGSIAANNDQDAGNDDIEYQITLPISEEVSSAVDEMSWGEIKQLLR